MTTLSNALNSSVKGADAAQFNISISANNIANASTPGYAKQTAQQESVVSEGVGQGVRITRVVNNVDTALLEAIKQQTSDLGSSNAVDEFLGTAQALFGTPGASGSLPSRIDDFFSAFQSLGDSPQSASGRLSLVNDATDLVSTVQRISDGIQNLRFEADQRLSSGINRINNLLLELQNTNVNINNFSEGSEGRLNIEQIRDLKIRELSELIDINSVINSDGTATISTGGGIALLDLTRFDLQYIPVASVNSIKNGASFNAVTAFALDAQGQINSNSSGSVLVSKGVSSAVTTEIASGEVRGLINLRDDLLVKAVDQLDNLAKSITDQVNAIHNDGSSFPPPAELTGTRSITEQDSVGFSGSVRIAVVNTDGTPASSPFTDEDYFRPLTLDLSTLDSGAGNGAGRPTIATIIEEINHHLGPVQNRAQIGNLRDIRLASLSTSVATGSSFNLDLELDNTSATSSTFQVTSVSVNNGGALSGGIPSGLSTGVTVAAGAKFRTGSTNDLTIDLTSGTGGPYTITVGVRTTEPNGTVTESDITYVVQADGSEDRNHRFASTSVTQTSTTGSSQFLVAPSNSSFATASLVDANGNPVSGSQSGFLKITSSNSSTLSVSIDELDSQEIGLSGVDSSTITNRGFSHYFGLNNFFVENSTLAGSASNFQLRSDISTNPNKVSTGELVLSTQPVDPNSALYTYELGIGNAAIVNRISQLDQAIVSFDEAGNLPATSTTISSYAGNIVGFSATAAANAQGDQEIQQLGLDGLLKTFQDTAGVDIDEQLALLIEYENRYRASVQTINLVRQLFDALLNSFR